MVGFDVSGSKYLRAITGPFKAFRLGWKLQKRNFDLAINSRWDCDSRHGSLVGLFCYPTRYIGFFSRATPRRRIMNLGVDGAFTERIRTNQVIHESMRGNQVLTALNFTVDNSKPHLWLSEPDIKYARDRLMEIAGKLVVLGIGASEAKRRWPISRFLMVAQHILASDTGAYFVVVGHKGDAAQAEQMRSALGTRLLNFAGTCSIAESGALLSRCSLYVGNDSGPMHMASAVGLPVIEISCHPPEGAPEHANSPDRYHPLSDPYKVARPRSFAAPCYYACTATEPHCILGVQVSDVVEAVDYVLAQQNQRLETLK